MTAKPSFDFLDAPRQQLRAADLDQRDLGLQPDAAAEAWRLGESQGLTPELALRNAEDVYAEAERQSLDRLAVESPAVAEWLAARPERLAVARDDLENLSALETWLGVRAPGRGTAIGRGLERYTDTLYRAPAEGFGGYFGQALTGLGDIWDASVRMTDRGLRGVFGPELIGDGTELPWWANPAEHLRRPGQAIRDTAGEIGVPEERRNFATDVTGGVGQLGGMTLQTIAAPQTLLPSLLGVGASQQADAAREQGAYGTAAADTAILAGAPTTAALERFGLSKLLDRLPPKIKSDVGRWLADKGIAAAYEGGQEIVEGLAQDTIAAGTFDPERDIGQGLAYEGTVAGTSAAVVRTLLGVRSPLRPVVEGAQDLERIEQLHALGAAAKTLDRAPAEVEQLVRQVVDRSPDAPTHVYLNTEELVTYFQSASLDPEQEIGQLTGDPQALAAGAGGDVVVPIERYVARALKSPHAEALKGMVRLAADRASNNDLASLDVTNLLDQIAPQTAEEGQESPSPVAQVAGRVREQLEAAGVEPSAAQAQAELLAQRYATRAARRGLGETALQVYEAAKLTIERPGEGPAPTGQRLEQPASDADVAAQMRGRRVLRGITRDTTAAEIDEALGLVEKIKTRLRDLPPAPVPTTAAAPDANSAGALGAFWSGLAAQEGVFSYARPDDGVTDLQAIADVIAPGVEVQQLSADDSGVTRYELTTVAGKKGTFEMEPGGELQLHIGDLDQGSAEGQQVYAIFNTWAARNGLKALPDRNGLSPINKYRRTENMLSSALRDGGTAHLFPADVQGLPHWRAGDFGAAPTEAEQGFNVGYLALKSAETALASVPLLDRVRFNFEARRFEDSKGREFTDGDFDTLSSQLQAGKIGVGRRSLKRAVVTASAVRELHGSGLDPDRVAELVAAARAGVGSDLRGDDAGGPLGRILYQTDETPPTGGVSAFGAYDQPADGDGPRGQIILGRNGQRTIQLLERANLSTFHHETGHLFLDELLEDAFTPGTPQQLREDLGRLLDWWGVETRVSQGREAVVAEVSRAVNHEKFARGYEAYLREGKAPSPALGDLFARFRTWMIAVYRQLRQLDITLTDEVRGVYDRLLATDDAIAAAQQKTGFLPLEVPADLRGLVTEAAWRRYRDELGAAAVEARQAVEQKLLAAQQREAEAWWKERRAEVRDQVLAEANARPDFRAQALLSRGRLPDGTDAPEGLEGLSLSREALVAQYGERFVVDRLKPLRVYRKTGGIAPDAAALLLGYRDGAELVAALDAMPRPKDWIEGETDRRMRDEYPDPLLDGSLPETALAEVHNDRQLALLATELGLLATMARQPMPERARDQVRLLGAAARQRIAGMKRRDIRPNDYLVAERKAARLATQAAAKGDFAEALRRKREQTLSAHLFRAASDATAEFDKARDYLRRFTRTDTRARLGKAGGSYLEQIDGLLELVEVRAVSGREVERRQSLAQWVEARAAAGESIDVPDAVLALTRLTNLRDMPIEQIRGLVDTVKQIDHLARLKTELLLGKERRDRAAVDAEMAASVRGAGGGRPENKGDRTAGERAREAVNQGLGAYLRPSTLARDLDGFEDSGAVWSHTVGIVQQAINNELTPALQKAQEELATIWRSHYTDAELRRMNTAISRGDLGSWSKGRILALALNWGNAGNREALLTQARKRLAPEQIGQLLGTLDARDVEFLNAIWAHVDSYWPAIADAQRRRTGLAPEKVEASPFAITLVDGTQGALTGGYFPLKYEAEGDPKASQDEQTEFWDAIRTGRFAKAQTKNGHTKERVGSGGRTVRLEISVLGSHVRDVLRDVHLGDAVNYVHRTLQGPEFRAALAEVGKLEYGKALDLWLRDVATGEMAPRTFFERVGRKLRTNFTASLLGFNISSALIQPTGFLQTGAALGWGTLTTGAQRFLTMPWTGPNSVGQAVDKVSPMMAARAQQSVEAVRKAEKALAGKRDGYVLRHAWVMMAKTQRIVDLVTWLGAEAKGLDEFGGDVAKARAYADDAVQRAQASGEFADKSAIERGTFGENVRQSELLRGTTALMSYMIAKGNVIYERTRQTQYKDPRQVGKLAVDLTSLLVIENLLIAVLRGGLPSDEDEDGILDDAALWFVQEGALGLLGTIPLIGQAGTTLRGYDAQGVIERLAKSGKKVTEALWDYADEDEPLTASDAKAAVSLTGMITGLPAAQTNRVLDAYLANEDGEDVAAHEFLIGRRKD